MKNWPHRQRNNISILALPVTALVTFTVAVLLVFGLKSVRGITISADDLAEMKTLAHKYLNERNRQLVSHDPDTNPNIADAPIIDPCDMSPGLAERHKEDVGKLRAKDFEIVFDDFATFTEVLNIIDDIYGVTLHVRDITCFHNIPPLPEAFLNECSSAGTERYFTFACKEDRWILVDVKLAYAGTFPPLVELSVKPEEKGGLRVMDNPPDYISEAPEEIRKLDEKATLKMANQWVINDRETLKAMEAGTCSWYE